MFTMYMITFSFDSLGHFKLQVSRLHKLSYCVYFILLPSEYILVTHSCSIRSNRFSLINGMIPDTGIMFGINCTHLHNILKNIPSTSTCYCKVCSSSIEITTHTNSKTKCQRQNATKMDITCVNVLPMEIKHVCDIKPEYISTQAEINIQNMIWVMEKFKQCLDKTTFIFNKNSVDIVGYDDECEGISTLMYEKGSLGCENIKIASEYLFLEKFWLLELSSCTCVLFTDPKTLKLCVLSTSEDSSNSVLLILD